jgi:NitT/TauT family transport system permease protein
MKATRSTWTSRFNIFRKPISWPWRVGLGVAAFVTIVVVYTIGSYVRQSADPNDMVLPNWSQLWWQGVVPALKPEKKGETPFSPATQAAIKEEGKQLEQSLTQLDEGERMANELKRLAGLAGPLSAERMRAEVLRRQAIYEYLLTDDRNRILAEEQKALTELPSGQREEVEANLKKIQEEYTKEKERHYIYKVRLWEDIKHTFWRLFVGLGIAVAVSLVLGVAMGCYAPVEAYFYPPLAVLAKIPGTVMLSLFFVIAGLNEKFYLSMILFGIIPTLTQTFYLYAKEVPEELLFKARTLGASQLECIFSVILPNILPKVMDAVRLAVGPALIFLYAAELTYGNEYEGLGCTLRLVSKKGIVESPTAYFYLVCIAAFGFLIDYSFRFAQKKLFPWYYSE